ncbi:neuropeptide FF receptor 1 [Molossus molossus]|uniref:neuropeptide FF receptor 1 n=1 Tax=Molossus molossus TaxID=27622 RepID=UPI0017460096|nr:neuropeptide FF receptor 1 [Molossus molossus]
MMGDGESSMEETVRKGIKDAEGVTAKDPDPYAPWLPGEPFQPSNSSWPPCQDGCHTEATAAANLAFSYCQHSSPGAAMLTVASGLIFLFCMVGNVLVGFIVLKNQHMSTVTNKFILDLASSDLLVGISCISTTLVDNLITAEMGLLKKLPATLCYSRDQELTPHKVPRLAHPFHKKLTLWKALVTLVVIRALALLVTCPQLSQ